MHKLRAAAILATLGFACKGTVLPEQGVKLVLDTDLTIPASIDEVGLYIEHEQKGQRSLVLAQEERPIYDAERGTYRVRFASTFAIDGAGTEEGDRVRVRFVGFHADGTPSVMREARVALTTSKVSVVRMPLLFINEGTVVDQSPTVSPRGLGPQQVSEGARDAFTRFRTLGCADEQTRGDDGACRSIDVEPGEIMSALPEPAATCFDVGVCFGGERGVRALPMEKCQVLLPELDGSLGAGGVAVAVESERGYAAGERTLQPLNDASYTYDPTARRVDLKPAACERLTAAGQTRLLVSVKCPAKPTSAPICSPWQESATPGAAGGAGYAGDPPPNDAGVDAGDTGDAGDAGYDNPFPFDFAMGGQSPLNSKLLALAADPAGHVWLLRDEADTRQAWSLDGPTSTALGSPVAASDLWYAEHLELGHPQGGALPHAYLLPKPGTPASTPLQAIAPNASAVSVAFAQTDGAGCTTSAAPEAISVGRSSTRTVAVHADNVDLRIAQSASDPCLPASTTLALSGIPVLYRGALWQQSWVIPTGNSELVRIDLEDNTANKTTLALTAGAVPQSFVVAGNVPLLIAKVPDAADPASFRPQIFVLSNTLTVQGAPLSAAELYAATREVYAGPGAFCARFAPADGAAVVRCFPVSSSGFGAPFEIEENVNGPDGLHLYGDDSNVYLARQCGDTEQVTRVHVDSVPWTSLDASFFERFADACPFITVNP